MEETGSLSFLWISTRKHGFGATDSDFIFTKKDLWIKLIQREVELRNKERKNPDKVTCFLDSTRN